MKAYLISKLIQALLAEMSKHAPHLIKGVADKVLDYVEDKVLGTASQADDTIVLPICNMIRATFDIADDE